MSFINFTNFSAPKERMILKKDLLEALIKYETKSKTKAQGLIKDLDEEVSFGTAISLFSNKLAGVAAINIIESGIPAEELEDETEDVTPEVVDADGENYAKADSRAEDSEEEVKDELVDGEDGSKEVADAVTESDLNDPVLMAFRAAKMNREKELAKPKRKPLYGKQRRKAEDNLWQISQDLKDLYADRGQMLIDMEQEAEVEGGPIADEYGDRLNKIEDQIQKLISKRNKLEMALVEGYSVKESINEKIKVTKDKFPYIEFKEDGKKYEVEFDQGDIIDDHGNEGKDWYYVGVDQNGDEWEIDVYTDFRDEPEDWFYDTIKRVDESVVTESDIKFKPGDEIEYKQLFGMGSKQDWTTLTGVVAKVKNKKKTPFGRPNPYQELVLKNGAVVSPYNNHKDIKLVESVVSEAKYDKKKLLKAIENSDDAMILVKGKEYIIYNPDNGNDDNAAMWGDKTIMALDQDGEEHEFKYSDIERFSESVVTEAKSWGTYGTPEAKTVTKALDKALAKFESSLEKAHAEYKATVKQFTTGDKKETGNKSGFNDTEGRDNVAFYTEKAIENALGMSKWAGALEYKVGWMYESTKLTWDSLLERINKKSVNEGWWVMDKNKPEARRLMKDLDKGFDKLEKTVEKAYNEWVELVKSYTTGKDAEEGKLAGFDKHQGKDEVKGLTTSMLIRIFGLNPRTGNYSANWMFENLNDFEAVEEGRSINKIKKEFDQVVSAMASKVASWKECKSKGDSEGEASCLAELKELTARKKALMSELDGAVGLKDINAELAENKLKGAKLVIIEGVMSDIHQMIGNHKSFSSFEKEFFKEYGHKKAMKRTPEFLEWLEALYNDFDYVTDESVGESSKTIEPLHIEENPEGYASRNFLVSDDLKDENDPTPSETGDEVDVMGESQINDEENNPNPEGYPSPSGDSQDVPNENEVHCEKCSHSWDVKEGGEDMSLCHQCGWDSMAQKYDLVRLAAWKEDVIKNVIGLQK